MPINGGEMFKEFCELIAHLQACPSSSAAIERVFFNFFFVYSKIPNRLTMHNVSKIVFCCGMLKQELLCNDDDDEA